jgi:hypothetical protein
LYVEGGLLERGHRVNEVVEWNDTIVAPIILVGYFQPSPFSGSWFHGYERTAILVTWRQ